MSKTNENKRCIVHIVVFWIITLCILVGGHQLFGTYCFHLQGRSKNRGTMFIHNVGNSLSDHLVSYPIRQQNDISPPQKLNISLQKLCLLKFTYPFNSWHFMCLLICSIFIIFFFKIRTVV